MQFRIVFLVNFYLVSIDLEFLCIWIDSLPICVTYIQPKFSLECYQGLLTLLHSIYYQSEKLFYLVTSILWTLIDRDFLHSEYPPSTQFFNVILFQVITTPTHKQANILDWVLTNLKINLSDCTVHSDPVLFASDHFAITFKLNIVK